MSDIEIRLEFTPNPNALKYVLEGQVLLEKGSANFESKADAQEFSPLAGRVMSLSEISTCLIGKNFVTITHSDDVDIEKLDLQIRESLQAHIASGDSSLSDKYLEKIVQDNSGDSEIVSKIKEILDRDIRPAVAQDGGDIVFESFEEGTVYLYLHGACASCPSATATLKQGVEVRLKEFIPEINEVVAL